MLHRLGRRGDPWLQPWGGNAARADEAVFRTFGNEEEHLANLTQEKPPTAMRDLGAIFADLNRVLTEVRTAAEMD